MVEETVRLYESGLSLAKVGNEVRADAVNVRRYLPERLVPLRNTPVTPLLTTARRLSSSAAEVVSSELPAQLAKDLLRGLAKAASAHRCNGRLPRTPPLLDLLTKWDTPLCLPLPLIAYRLVRPPICDRYSNVDESSLS